MTLSVYLLYFGTDQTAGMIVFSMGPWNSTDSVPLFVFLLYFGTVLTVRVLFVFLRGIWDYSHSVALSVYLLDFRTDQKV